jgi:hypothetical protein
VIYLSTYTTNFKLKKPELSDTADLTQYNESWDKVDSTLKEHADKLNNTLGKLSVNGKTPNSNGEITLTADDVNAATEEFVEDYVEDKLALVTGKPLEENSISGKVISTGTLPADRLEGSLPISKGGTGATSASSAREALGITPENIGAVPLDGSVAMTGSRLRLNGEKCSVEAYDGQLAFRAMNEAGKDANSRTLNFYAGSKQSLDSAVRLTDYVDGNPTYYKIFGEHNKPTGFYSGNGSAEQRTIPIGGVGSILWIKSAKYLTFVWNFGGFTLDGVNGSVKFHPSSQLDFEDGVLTIASTHSAINDSTNVHYYGYVG